jgi:hypothetical protein
MRAIYFLVMRIPYSGMLRGNFNFHFRIILKKYRSAVRLSRLRSAMEE